MVELLALVARHRRVVMEQAIPALAATLSHLAAVAAAAGDSPLNPTPRPTAVTVNLV
jgi:hypothetical protein